VRVSDTLAWQTRDDHLVRVNMGHFQKLDRDTLIDDRPPAPRDRIVPQAKVMRHEVRNNLFSPFNIIQRA